MNLEERMCEQRMLKARSIDGIERLRDLDRDKLDLERKLNDARTAIDGYSEKLKNKVRKYSLDIHCVSYRYSCRISVGMDPLSYCTRPYLDIKKLIVLLTDSYLNVLKQYYHRHQLGYNGKQEIHCCFRCV